MTLIRHMKGGKARAEAYKAKALALPGVQGASVYAGSHPGAYHVIVYGDWPACTSEALLRGVRSYDIRL